MNNPDHYATTATVHGKFDIYYLGEPVAGSSEAVELCEYYDGRALTPVYYFAPEVLINLEIRKSDHTTFCPIKGDTRYWHFRDAENTIWSYPDPIGGVEAIGGFVAFDTGSGFRIEHSAD